ncbi:uncharacterized protein LOC100899389 [Galendromus occidentalis]|uniref:Uncharacterized protein LOC100899389 n=1 Tax=Galendromus occidentalis TaxID=34638 RepID=A0AAJ6VVI6_9ACAR|nr:uncharacterized protein LOC100899389 [Galendromus occidentalis]
MRHLSILSVGLILLLQVARTRSHGRLWEPPSRSTAFRRGFRTPKNYNDHESFCGGLQVMYQLNGGKCGLCGDPWNSKKPRPNEAGGIYDTGTIVRSYKEGKRIKAAVFVTTNHLGYFEFQLCPNSSNVTEDCFHEHKLNIYGLEQKKTKRLYIGSEDGMIPMKLRLPDGIKCERCVLRWQYTTGNFWGKCTNGTTGMGCGNQEVYRACADIAIL